MLEPNEQQLLLSIARDAIACELAGETRSTRPDLPPTLTRMGAAFVTLHLHGELRGCIGSIIAVEPLDRAVASAAVSAAFRDPRFAPLTAAEFAEIGIDISVISPMVRVDDVSEIEVGRDGLMVTFGSRRGLLLPQVATEYGWDRQTFLEQTCRKAGLAQSAWRDPGCRIEKFTAQVFSSKSLAVK